MSRGRGVLGVSKPSVCFRQHFKVKRSNRIIAQIKEMFVVVGSTLLAYFLIMNEKLHR